jgi:AraC family transcriptional regulator
MTLASQRLNGTQQTVAEIARSLGYDSASAFTKTFRRNTGQSPRDLRQATVPAIPLNFGQQ